MRTHSTFSANGSLTVGRQVATADPTLLNRGKRVADEQNDEKGHQARLILAGRLSPIEYAWDLRPIVRAANLLTALGANQSGILRNWAFTESARSGEVPGRGHWTIIVATVATPSSEQRPKAALPRVQVALHSGMPLCLRRVDGKVPADAGYLTHEVAFLCLVARQLGELQAYPGLGMGQEAKCTRRSRGGPGVLSLRRQLALESDALEFLTEMLDPIFGLLALHRRHKLCNIVGAGAGLSMRSFG